MATPASCLQGTMEETPRPLDAATTTPYRLSTVPRYFRFQRFGNTEGVQALDLRDQLGTGFAGPPPQLVDGYQPAGSFETRAYVNDLPFLFPLAGLSVTITPGGAGVVDITGANVPTGAYKATFQPNTSATQTPQAMQFTACYVPAQTFVRMQGTGISRIGMNAAGQVTGDLMALVHGTINDPNLTPTYDSSAIPPLRSGDIAVNPWLTGAGTADDFTWEIANPLERYRGIGVASYFPRELQVGEDVVVMTGTRSAKQLTDADIDALASLQTFAGRAVWQSPFNVGATAAFYKLILDLPAVQLNGGSADDLREARRFGANWNWIATVDPTTSRAFRLETVGSISAVATYV